MNDLSKVLDQFMIAIPSNGKNKGINVKLIKVNNKIAKLVDLQNQHLEEIKSLQETMKSKCSKEICKIKDLKSNMKQIELEFMMALGERRAYLKEEKLSVKNLEMNISRQKLLVEKP